MSWSNESRYGLSLSQPEIHVTETYMNVHVDSRNDNVHCMSLCEQIFWGGKSSSRSSQLVSLVWCFWYASCSHPMWPSQVPSPHVPPTSPQSQAWSQELTPGIQGAWRARAAHVKLQDSLNDFGRLRLRSIKHDWDEKIVCFLLELQDFGRASEELVSFAFW